MNGEIDARNALHMFDERHLVRDEKRDDWRVKHRSENLQDLRYKLGKEVNGLANSLTSKFPH